MSKEVNWQQECLKKGFEYVREPDDHYVVASPAEMVALLRDLLGVDVRTKDCDSYGVAVCELQEQIDGLVNTIHAQQAERDALLAELDALILQIDTLTERYSNRLEVIREITAALPGAYYMDPPDGGDVSIPEQVRRMAKDAERYRWLRMADWWNSPLCVIRDPKQQAKPGTDCPSRDRLDEAIDAALQGEQP